MNDIVPLMAIISIFIVLPSVILHHVTAWKKAKTLTGDDEQLLDHMYDTARRLENRLEVLERIVRADNPDYHSGMSASHMDNPTDPESDNTPTRKPARNRRK